MGDRVVTFHEAGRVFTWSVAGQGVYNEHDGLIGLANKLSMARLLARGYLTVVDRRRKTSIECPTCGDSLLAGDHRDCAI